ncbi:hypothetical protein L1887_28437 [Cichorium endivia]|nr:hypothetical protein L1887_28437 [Cichorium endivia]
MSTEKEKERGDLSRDQAGSRDSGRERQPEGERPPKIQSNMQAMIATEVTKVIKEILPTYLKPQAEATIGGTSGQSPVQPERREDREEMFTETSGAKAPEKIRKCTYDVFQNKCDETDKVEFATNLLKEDAQFWRENICVELGESLVLSLIWEQFKLKLMEHYRSNGYEEFRRRDLEVTARVKNNTTIHVGVQ